MNEWIKRNLETLLIVAGGVVVLLYTATIPLHKGSWPHGVLFAVVSFPAWCVFAKTIIPPFLRVDAAFNAAKGSAKCLPLAGCVATCVCLIWMFSAVGTGAALLGGPRFSRGICHYLTNFSWMHIVVGIGVTLPFLAAAGVCHAIRWRRHHVDNTTGVQAPLSR